MSDRGEHVSRQTLTSLALGTLVFFLAAFLCLSRRPLGDCGQLSDEWWLLGLNVAVSGTVGLSHEAFLGRAPGYPALIGAVLRIFTDVPDVQSMSPQYVDQAVRLLLLIQCLLHGIATMSLLAWMRMRLRMASALAVAIAFGLNPYSLILCGLLHYDVLHILLLILSGWATTAALSRPIPRATALLGSGVLWGLTALVRAITLPLPLLFPAIVLLGEGTWRATRKAVLVTALLTTGMALTIAPWTFRNYRLSHRIVAVNAQAWTALWGSVVMPLPLDPNRYLWYLLATRDDYLPVIQKVTGSSEYHYYAQMSRAIAMEDALREKALTHLRRQPAVYARNVARSFITFNFQINSLFVSVFERLQASPPGSFQHGWSTRADAPERQPTPLSRAFEVFFLACLLLALWGIVRSVRDRNAFVLVPAAIYACLCLAHSFIYMDLTYYYVKMPFVFLFAGFGLEAVYRGRRTLELGRTRISVGATLGTLLAASAVALTIGLFWSTAR
jgi:hypothetical protein